ncbi:hypothetical protein SAMN04487866_10844 [Thermoactinomyces sp. DSM 45891]|uniref:hypothetical protein n=1 Tax=Thermoactinomyces sp. DSM 45891 TaxID=1761907 RepID=UPI0009218BED|nr:hypothetical protein [Thermoactinomyces sp. DSM 45891]SFX44944.1 hypothetical protein SAMN04487866_10844 [Thermoactinomyces sp. DSM 45891]
MIIQIKGDTNFTINIDPGVWIFDERRFTIEPSSLGMALRPFLINAEPKEGAHTALIHRRDGEKICLSYEEILHSYLCFAIDGKPLGEKQGGPALLYLRDQDHKSQPIDSIQTIEIVSS